MDIQTSPRSLRRSTLGDDLIHAILGLVVVTAVYADGRAHTIGLPDSFFTPWHAFLYGGLAAMVLWLGIISFRAARRADVGRLIAIPPGYGMATVGAILFALGGVADMLWHLAFGVEFGIDALISPSHLLLFVGGGLLLSGPLLALREREGSTPTPLRIPALLSVIGVTAVAAFALAFLSAFISDAPTTPVAHEPEGSPAHQIAESLASAGLGSFIVTTLLLVAPALYLLRSKIWFPGSVAALLTVVAFYAAFLTGFDNPVSIVTALLAGALVDVAVVALRPRVSGRALELLTAAAVPLLVWPGQLAAVAIRYGLGWSEEMTSGVVVVSAAVSLVTVLAIGSATPSTGTETARSASSVDGEAVRSAGGAPR